MKQFFLLLTTFSLLILGACGGGKKNTDKELSKDQIVNMKNNLEQLAILMEGRFSNEEQHKADPENYFHIIMKICRIWDDRDDGIWFYVEQGLATLQENPYRQRVYRLIRGERDTLISEVYTLPEPKDYVGGCSNEKLVNKLNPKDLELRDGCAVIMTRTGKGFFKGGTKEGTCASNLKGATTVSSEIELNYDLFKTWDRGFDENGKHIWGAENGPYEFKRILEE
jgi:CpeT protein